MEILIMQVFVSLLLVTGGVLLFAVTIDSLSRRSGSIGAAPR